MYYKFDIERNEWYVGSTIYFPTGEILTLENKLEFDGWKFHEEPPIEYLKWIEDNE
jgi:hypothetical protein